MKRLRRWGYPSVVKPQVVKAWGLSAMLGLSGAIALAGIISTPQAAQAYIERVTLFLSRGPEEDYETFLRRAEAITRAAVQRSFDTDLLMTEVIVVVVGENQGLSIPIMEVQVTRNEWRERPDPQYWARYYESAPRLLSF
ncbi:MAG: hypothetical protein F6K42_04340 [Leptolyngbya sp. SIO1D8]|nr:hypothetical protein [Leptolyngbya sp. SIO1D8]